MGPDKIWDFIYKCQQEQIKKGNTLVDDSFYCLYPKCNKIECIQIYNKDEWCNEWICKECFIDDWGETDYCIVLPTLYDDWDYEEKSIFEKFGGK